MGASQLHDMMDVAIRGLAAHRMVLERHVKCTLADSTIHQVARVQPLGLSSGTGLNHNRSYANGRHENVP